jgi:hypothetical protein
LRAVALQILGEAYMSVKKEDGSVLTGNKGFEDDADYVRIDMKSRARNSQQGQQQTGQQPGSAKR